MRYLIIALLFSSTLYGQRNGSVTTSYYNSKPITESVGLSTPPVVVPTCATDTIFTTDWFRNDAATIIQVDNWALDSNSIDAMNSNSSRWIKGALANDMDSLYVVISTSSATPVEFRITTSTDSIDWTHTTTTGSYNDFRGDWAPITGLQADSVKIRVINRFCHFDYAVVQKGGYPCSSE